MTPEFSRPERLDTIGERARAVAVSADAAERAALARRFALVAVDRLEGQFTLRRDAAGFLVDGRVSAAVVQACSITGDPVPATIDEPVALRFVTGMTGEGEIELSDDAIDEVEIEGDAIDLGETAAETLALALDPFPRAPGAEAALRAAGVLSEEEHTPFNAFAAALKGKLPG